MKQTIEQLKRIVLDLKQYFEKLKKKLPWKWLAE